MYRGSPTLKRKRGISEGGEEDRDANWETRWSAPRWMWTFGWMAVSTGSWESTLDVPLTLGALWTFVCLQWRQRTLFYGLYKRMCRTAKEATRDERCFNTRTAFSRRRMSREAGLWTDGNPSALGMAPLRYYAARDGAPMEPRSNGRAII